MAVAVRQTYSTVNPAYEEFMCNEQRYNVLYGSAGSGKSQAAAQKVIKRCITETGTPDNPFVHSFTVFRKYKTTVLGSVFSQLKEEIIRLGLQDIITINESYHAFRFWNGATIRCIGFDDPEKIKSIVSTAAWVEEATELELSDWTQLDLRYRGQTQYFYQLILTFNPTDETSWIKRQFFDTPQGDLTYILHTTYEDNFFIDDQYRQVLKDRFSFDPNLFRVYVEGKWGRVKCGSEFFYNFRHEKHVRDCKYVEGLPLHISFDWNVNPFISAIVCQILKREIPNEKGGTKPFYFINVIDEFALANPFNNTESLCDAIITRYEHELKAGVMIYGDVSGRAHSTRSSVNDFDIVEHIFARFLNNYSFRVPKANPMVQRRRVFIAKMMYGGFNIELAVNPKCTKLIGDFENTIENQEGGVQKSTARDKLTNVVFEKFTHHSDCFSYLVCESFSGHFDSMSG